MATAENIAAANAAYIIAEDARHAVLNAAFAIAEDAYAAANAPAKIAADAAVNNPAAYASAYAAATNAYSAACTTGTRLMTTTSQPTTSQPAKRGRGRPPGPALPPADLLHPHTIRLTAAEWEDCRKAGDASAYIRGLIRKDIKKK